MTIDEAQERAIGLVETYTVFANDYRVGRAVNLITSGHVHYLGEGKFEIESGSRTGLHHYVDLPRATCTCEDRAKGYRCKHLIAAFLGQ